MKNLITYLKTLWGAWGNLQSNDAICDGRLTVVRPSFDCRSKLLKYITVLALLLTVGVGDAWGDETFTRVTDLSQLSDGDEVILVNNAANGVSAYAMSTTQNTNNRGRTSVSISNGGVITLSSGHSVQILTLKINASSQYGFHTGSGYLVKSGGNRDNYLTTNSTASSTAPSGNYAWTPSIASSGNTNKKVTLRNVGSNAFYLQYNSSGVFSSYKNTQGDPCIFKKTQSCTLSSISLNTTSVQKTFCVGDALNYTGLVTTATYTGGCANAAVTPTSVTVPSGAMNTAGSKTVTVSYTEGGVTKTATYTITVQAKYTVTWMVNGSSYSAGTPTTQVCPGSHVTSLPTAPDPASYCGEVFAGWTDDEYSGDSAPTHLYKTASEFPNATSNQIFYAVFADYAD